MRGVIQHLEAKRRRQMADYALAAKRHRNQGHARAALIKATAAALREEIAERRRRRRVETSPDLFGEGGNT